MVSEVVSEVVHRIHSAEEEEMVVSAEVRSFDSIRFDFHFSLFPVHSNEVWNYGDMILMTTISNPTA